MFFCDLVNDSDDAYMFENVKGRIEWEYEIQTGQTAREIVGFTLPFSYHCVSFLKIVQTILSGIWMNREWDT